MTFDPKKSGISIVGVAESPLGEVHSETELSMVALAAREALGEAGLSLRDVDGLFVNYMGEGGTVQVGEYLGIEPRYADSTDLGGAAFESFIHHGMVALAAERCDVALICYASRQRSKKSRRMLPPSGGSDAYAPDRTTLTDQLQTPYGLPSPIGDFALITARHMHQYGTTREQIAEVAVAARRWAERNPKAFMRKPLTIDDVLASPLIAEPIRRLDCCLVTDGGGALVMTRGDRAKDAKKKPVKVLGAAEFHRAWNMAQMGDLTVSAGRESAREAFAMAGISPSDVDVFEPYDAFTISIVLAVEDLGFCAKGEGGAFVSGGRLAPGGALPSMTSGGGLSYCHPGALGLLLLIEAVRQLRAESGERQVKDAEVAVAHGIGGSPGSIGSTVVLGRG